MNGERWTLLLFRGERRPRQYSLSSRALHLGLGGVALLTVTLSGLFLDAAREGATRFQARQLAEENRVLAGELDRLRGQVAGLEETVDGLSEKDARIRLLAGLDSIDTDILRVGVGGPGTSSPEEHALWPLDSALAGDAFAAAYDVKALERRARLLNESMAEAADSLEAHRALLESTPSILPTPGLLSSRFARGRLHPIHHRPLPHEGIDVSAPAGTPVLAAARGRVVRSEWVTGYGRMVEIDHGYGFVTRYGHASRLLVRQGQTVERGDVIAHVGSSGIATAPHLHYEVRVNGRPQNPLNYVIPDAIP